MSEGDDCEICYPKMSSGYTLYDYYRAACFQPALCALITSEGPNGPTCKRIEKMWRDDPASDPHNQKRIKTDI